MGAQTTGGLVSRRWGLGRSGHRSPPPFRRSGTPFRGTVDPMAVADLVSSAGVVTIDLNANPADFYRLSTTESVTSFTLVNVNDGDGFLIGIDLNSGHTVTFTGLVDIWTNGVPTLTVGQTVYFPVLKDSGNMIGESTAVQAVDPALTLQTINHTVAGVLVVSGTNGHTVEATLTANVTGHTISNLNDGEHLTVFYEASVANRTVDFTGLTEFANFNNPGVVTVLTGTRLKAVFARVDGVTYLISATTAEVVDPSLVLNTIAHSANGLLVISGANGHTVEATLTANVTGHTLSNLNDGEKLTVFYEASAANRTVDFTAATDFTNFTGPGVVTVTSGTRLRAEFAAVDGTIYLMSVSTAPVIDPATVINTVSHTANGALVLDADDGHTAEVTLTANATSHTLSNISADDVLSVHYKASGATRTIDFTGVSTADGLTNPGSVDLVVDGVYRSVWAVLFGTTYLLDAEVVA